MKVSITIRHQLTHAEAEAQLIAADFIVRCSAALMRLDNLDQFAPMLSQTSRIDAATAAWDDYIDGRRAAERSGPLSAADIAEQAMVFARVATYLPPADLLRLARAAWGGEMFDAYTRLPDGTITGKLGWFRGGKLSIRYAAHDLPHVLDAWEEEGEAIGSVRSLPKSQLTFALHPVFGVPA